DRLQDPGLLLPLRQLQAQLGSSNGLTPALRRAENLLPALRQDAPQLLSRLAACFYWSIINHGDPEDIPRYQRVFGAPADDPRFERLSALACEHWGHLDEAHKYWRDYEKTVAANPAVWPGDQAARVRALIWSRMGHNAASVPNLDRLPKLPPFLRDHPGRPQPLSP